MTDSPAVILYDSTGTEIAVANGVAIPVGTRSILVAGTDGTNARTVLVDSSGRPVVVGAGVAGTPAGGILSIQGVGGGTPVPVSGSFTTGDTTATGNLNALNAAVSVAQAGEHSVGLQLAAGTLVGTIVPELSFDGGVTWVSTFFDDPTTGAKSASIVFASNNTATASSIIGAGGVSNVRVRVSAFTSGTAAITVKATQIDDPSTLFDGVAGGALPPTVAQVGGSDGTNLRALRTASDGTLRVDPTGVTTQPVSGTVTVNGTVTSNQGTAAALASAWPVKVTDGTNTMPTMDVASRAGFQKITDGTNTASVTAASALKVDGSAVTQPVSGTVTANQGTAAALASAWPVKVTDGTNTLPTMDVASRAGFQKITDGTNTAAVKAASTAPLATDPALVVAISPNSSLTATNPSVGSNNSAIPTSSTQVGGSDGTNLQAARVFDVDTSGGTQYVLGVGLRKAASGGSVEAGTASDPLRVDPTGSTTQPVSGTVTANQGTAAALASAWPVKVTDGTNTMPTMDVASRAGFQKITDGTNTAAVKAASTAAAAADPSLVVGLSPNSPLPAGTNTIGRTQSFLTSPNAVLANLFAFVSPYGTLRTSTEPSALFTETFEGGVLDTTVKWNATAVGGAASAVTNATLVLSIGTIGGDAAAISTQPTFAAQGIGFLVVGWIQQIEAAAVAGSHHFFGLGVPPTVWAVTTPLQNAVGFEQDTTGNLNAVIYQSGSIIFSQALTRPNDGAFHRYAVAVRSDLVVWYLDSIEVPVASANFLEPSITTLPFRVHVMNPVVAPGSSPVSVTAAIGVGDSSNTNHTLSDGKYPWQKANIDATGALKVANQFTAQLTNGNNSQLVVDPEIPAALEAIRQAIFFYGDLTVNSQHQEVRDVTVPRSQSKTVASSATSVLILEVNVGRTGATIFNDSTQVLYLNLDDQQASTTVYTVRMLPNAYYELPFHYAGAISGIWAAANGNARITEFLF